VEDVRTCYDKIIHYKEDDMNKILMKIDHYRVHGRDYGSANIVSGQYVHDGSLALTAESPNGEHIDKVTTLLPTVPALAPEDIYVLDNDDLGKTGMPELLEDSGLASFLVSFDVGEERYALMKLAPKYMTML
jgi:hypothetical protein